MSATLEPLGYAPLTPDEIDQALDLIGVKPRSTSELARRLSSTPQAIRAALWPLIDSGHLIRPPGGDWRPGDRFGAAPGPRPAPPPHLPELEAPPEDQPSTLHARILALVRVEPGIAQAEVGRRLGDQASASRICKYAETLGQIRREKIAGTVALRLFPASPPAETVPAPEEDPGGDCDGVGEGVAALSEHAARLQALQAERAAAWATLGQPQGPDLPAAILGALESARRGLPLADAGETVRLRARVAELEKMRDDGAAGMLAVQEANSQWLLEIDAALDLADIPRKIQGEPATTPERARFAVWGWTAGLRARAAELAGLRDDLAAAEEAERRLSAELSALEDAPPPSLAPRWEGSRLIALRPVEIGRIERGDDGLWTWEAESEDGPEDGTTPTEARARRWVERAVGEAPHAAR
jgi:hypothetical protein